MSHVLKVAVPAIKLGFEFVRKNWTAIGAAFALISTFLTDHPEIPSKIRSRMSAIQRRLLLQIVKPSLESQVKGILGVIRDEASVDGDDFKGERWIDSANAIERDLRLAQLQERVLKKQTIARLRQETDKLVADLLVALADQRANPEISNENRSDR